MKDTDYTNAVARIRYNEAFLPTAELLQRAVAAKTAPEAAALLAESGAEPDLLLQKAWELVDEVNPEPSRLDFLRVSNDFHNLKAVLKGVVSDKEYTALCVYPTITPTEQLEAALRDQRFDRLPAYMASAAEQAYDAFVRSSDGQQSDLILDTAAMNATAMLAAATKDEFLSGLGTVMVRARALRIAARAARLSLSGDYLALALPNGYEGMALAAAEGVSALGDYLAQNGESDAAAALTDSIAALERYCDSLAVAYIEKVRYSCFGAGPLAAYIIKAGALQRNMRIIDTGKRSGLSEQEIKRRLRQAV